MNRILWSGLLLLSLVFSNLPFRGFSASQVELPGMPPRGDYAAGDTAWYEHVRVSDGSGPLNPPVGGQIENMNGEPDPWNKIVMMSYRNENWEIYLAPSGSYGAPINRVTIYSRDDINPSLNRGADTIIYSSYREGYYNLFSIKTDGSSQVRLTSHKANDDEPQWAPYGLEFVFVSDRDGNREIYKMIRDGNQQIRLTNHPNGDFSPIYSPDGSKIAWVRVVNSTQGQIMVMNLDGSNQQPMSPPINYLTDLAWSPKGDAISFSYIKDLSYPYYALGRYLIDTDQVQYLKGCGSSRDCRNGSYMSESQLIFTDMRWELIGNDWYITEMLVKKYIPNSSTTQVFTNSAWDFAPEAAPIDTVAPRVTPGPLPDFAPAAGLTLSWSTYDDRSDSDPITFLQYQRNSIWYGIGAYSLPTESTNIKGTAGETYEFRFYASDSAGNVSQIPKQGTKPVTFYDWAVNGHYTDVRGVPVPGVVHPDTAKCLNKGPTFPSDPTGTLDCYMKENSNTFSPQKSGYEKIASTTLDKKQAGPYDWVFPPGDNLTANGNFEEAPSILASDDQTTTLPGWDVTGVLSPVQTASQRVYGTNSALFGQANPLGEIELITGTNSISGTPELVEDSSGGLHIVLSNHYDGILYTHRPAGGSWSSLEVIYPGEGGEAVALAITPDDSLHVIWVVTTGVGDDAVQKIRYIVKPSGQPWTAPVDVVSGTKIYNLGLAHKPLLAADGLGGLHAVWPDMIGLMIVHHPAGGAWGVPEKLSPILCNAFDITTTLDGTTWILWGDSPGLVLQSRNPDGTWNPVEILTEVVAEYLHVDIADDGSQYVVYAYLEDIYFIERADAGSSWSPPIIVGVIDGYAGNLNLISGPSGELHLAFFQDWNIFYRIRYPDGKWSIGGLMPEQDRKFPPAMIPEADGSAQAVWADTNDSFAYSVLHLPKTGLGSLEETINISTQAYQPTLSFFFNLPNALADRSFEARIGGQAVFSTSTATSGWERRWIDLSPWKGQQVTVQFLLTEGPMDTQVYVYLDEVMAGSARTPTINSVEVEADQVTVKGTNFLEGVDVWIGGVQVAVVNRVDAQTLLMTLPEGLLPGWQAIRVINPQGEEAWMKNGLFWKEVLHIPLVSKNYR